MFILNIYNKIDSTQCNYKLIYVTFAFTDDFVEWRYSFNTVWR